MDRNVVIIGASGHGRVIADTIMKSGDHVLGFLDDDRGLPGEIAGIPLLGVVSDYRKYRDACFVIGIGNPKIREKIAGILNGQAEWYTAVHPAAVLSVLDVRVGEGTVVMANAVINAGAKIGRHCIVNTGAIVEHDCVLEDFVHISPNAALAGAVTVGTRSWIGVGASVRNNLRITGDCMIGAGSTVVKDIGGPGTYVGTPARRLSAGNGPDLSAPVSAGER